MHGALENTTSAQQLPDGRYVCVYRPPGWRERQHTKYKVTKKVRKWRVEVCVPSLVGHSLGSFYGLFKAVVQTKQSFLYFYHDILKDQARGWGRWKCTANSALKRGCCFTVKALLLTLEAHPQATSPNPSQMESQVTREFLCTCRGGGVPEMGLKLSHRGQARIEQVTVVPGQFSPQTQAKEDASENA